MAKQQVISRSSSSCSETRLMPTTFMHRRPQFLGNVSRLLLALSCKQEPPNVDDTSAWQAPRRKPVNIVCLHEAWQPFVAGIVSKLTPALQSNCISKRTSDRVVQGNPKPKLPFSCASHSKASHSVTHNIYMLKNHARSRQNARVGKPAPTADCIPR